MRLFVLAAFVAGCAAVPPADPPPGDAPAAGEGVCNAGPVQNLIGQQRSDAVGADAMLRSGARALRWLGPDTAYTQDFRQDRLNIEITAGGRITGLRCF